MREVAVYDRALSDLLEAGVRAELRKPFPIGEAGDQELDVWLNRADVVEADRVLEHAGFHRVRVSGHAPHRFYIAFSDGRWHKIDAKLAQDHALATRIRSALKHAPAGLRRYGPVIAVLGPDGAGKSTLLAELQRSLPLSVHVAYLGRRGRTPPPGTETPTATPARTRTKWLAESSVGELAFVGKHLFRRARTLARAYGRAWTGTIVLCDRHPIETLAIDPRRRPAARLLERLVIKWLLPWPDAVIVLDAPSDVLYERKQEHPLERLHTWRHRYRQEFAPRGARFVETDGPFARALAEVATHVFEALAARTREPWQGRLQRSRTNRSSAAR